MLKWPLIFVAVYGLAVALAICSVGILKILGTLMWLVWMVCWTIAGGALLQAAIEAKAHE